jgi:hypothetical protein
MKWNDYIEFVTFGGADLFWGGTVKSVRIAYIPLCLRWNNDDFKSDLLRKTLSISAAI